MPPLASNAVCDTDSRTTTRTATSSRGRPGFSIRFRLLCRRARALSTAPVLTVRADPLCAKGRLTSVALTTNSHADWLLYPFHWLMRRTDPLIVLKGQAILGEQRPSPLYTAMEPNVDAVCTDLYERFSTFSGWRVCKDFGRFRAMPLSIETKSSVTLRLTWEEQRQFHSPELRDREMPLLRWRQYWIFSSLTLSRLSSRILTDPLAYPHQHVLANWDHSYCCGRMLL
jgi:hypothetical protein